LRSSQRTYFRRFVRVGDSVCSRPKRGRFVAHGVAVKERTGEIRTARSLERARDCGLPKGDDLTVLPLNKHRWRRKGCQVEVTGICGND